MQQNKWHIPQQQQQIAPQAEKCTTSRAAVNRKTNNQACTLCLSHAVTAAAAVPIRSHSELTTAGAPVAVQRTVASRSILALGAAAGGAADEQKCEPDEADGAKDCDLNPVPLVAVHVAELCERAQPCEHGGDAEQQADVSAARSTR